MKKILRTTLFRLIVVFGFGLYMKLFDANMAAMVSSRLGVTTISTSGEAIPTVGEQVDIMSGINSIQLQLTNMQGMLNALAGQNAVPVVEPTPVIEPAPVTTNTPVAPQIPQSE